MVQTLRFLVRAPDHDLTHSPRPPGGGAGVTSPDQPLRKWTFLFCKKKEMLRCVDDWAKMDGNTLPRRIYFPWDVYTEFTAKRKGHHVPNIAKLLKDEIQRLAKREIKLATDNLRKDNAALKRTVADLKRRLTKLESDNKRLVAKAEVDRPQTAANDAEPVKARITGKMILSIRQRLGLSQNAFAKLVGVSSQAVYQWERRDGRLDLRGDSKAAIVGIRSMGKREAQQRLAGISGTNE